MPLSQKLSDDLNQRISSLKLPKNNTKKRCEALKRIKVMGLPSRRDEYWKYTNPSLFNNLFSDKNVVKGSDDKLNFDSIGCFKLIFTDGVFDQESSDSLESEELELVRISDSSVDKANWLEDFYGSLEEAGQNPVDRPLAKLNTAFATDGLALRVTGKITKPINIVYNETSYRSDVNLHHCIKLEQGSSLTLIESGSVSSRLNKVTELEVAQDSSFHHVCTQTNNMDKIVSTHLFARLWENSVLKSFTLTTSGALTRNEHVVELKGNNGISHLAAACIGEGRFHHDDTVFVTHEGTHCESRQVFKKVLKKGAFGIFQGKILVKPGAQKTDGYQISQSLLLDDDSQFLAKPELEIYADDVVCSHGSTSGAIDEEGLFYLRARGVPENTAKDLLILAFLAEALAEIEDTKISELLLTYLERSL